jgi:hypothetical protein
MSIPYSECVFVALDIQHAMSMTTTRVCIWTLSYPACNAHAPYCHLCPALQYFSTLSHKRYDFRKKKVIVNKMCVSSFSTGFVWKIFHAKKNWARYDLKCILVSMKSTLYSCPILMKLEFSPNVFEKCLNIKLHKYPSNGSRVVYQCGETDRHDETNSRFSQCFVRA